MSMRSWQDVWIIKCHLCYSSQLTGHRQEGCEGAAALVLISLGFGLSFSKHGLIYYSQGRAKKVVKAQKLWFSILQAQIETGNPYMLFKVCFCSIHAIQDVCLFADPYSMMVMSMSLFTV